jgi:hypothetical protein
VQVTERDKFGHEGNCCSSLDTTAGVAAQSINSTSAETIHARSHADSVAIGSLDNLGMAASTICLIHCLLMPFVIAMLPVLGWQCLESKSAHHILAFFVFCFALFAIVPGYMKHKRSQILLSMIAGLSLVLIATFVCGPLLPESLELPLITAGNLILVATHWQNRKLSACEHSH